MSELSVPWAMVLKAIQDTEKKYMPIRELQEKFKDDGRNLDLSLTYLQKQGRIKLAIGHINGKVCNIAYIPEKAKV